MDQQTNVTVKEVVLSDNSKVYDVVLNHYSGHIEFSMYSAKEADKFSGDLLEVLRRNGFIF